MRGSKPPATLDQLRALLDAAAVRRRLLPLAAEARTPEELAVALAQPVGAVIRVQVAACDGDFVAALIPADRRLNLPSLAVAVGARRARLAGGEDVRRRLGTELGLLAPLTGLPTVMDRRLMGHDYLFAATGDPLWCVRLSPSDLKRASAAIVAPIVRPD